MNKLDVIIRIRLGDRDFSGYKVPMEERPTKLRFDMTGDETTIKDNKLIWDLFYPYLGEHLSIRKFQDNEKPVTSKYRFDFRAGAGFLMFGTSNDDLDYIKHYRESTTVEILTDLIERLCPNWDERHEDMLKNGFNNLDTYNLKPWENYCC